MRSSLPVSYRTVKTLSEGRHICPSCSLWQVSQSPLRARTSRPPVRRVSYVASSTAISATKDVPPRFEELYVALKGVKKKAAAQVSLSRLDLALQGLESDNPVIRIAGAQSLAYICRAVALISTCIKSLPTMVLTLHERRYGCFWQIRSNRQPIGRRN